MNPKVAIIIANYNYEDYVIKAINSVLNQTYDGEIRIYVVDDGSSDSSWDKISQMTEPVTSIEMLDPHYKGNIEFRQSNNIFARVWLEMLPCGKLWSGQIFLVY